MTTLYQDYCYLGAVKPNNMARKDTPERKRELELKDELEQMIAQDAADITAAVQQAKSILPARSTSGFLDYETVKIDSDGTAKNIVDSIAEFESKLSNVNYETVLIASTNPEYWVESLNKLKKNSVIFFLLGNET